MPGLFEGMVTLTVYMRESRDVRNMLRGAGGHWGLVRS